MKKNYFVFFVISALLCSYKLTAQVSADPCDEFYAAAEGWYVRGVIDELPPVKPYSLPVIKHILKTTVEKGSKGDSAAAKAYYERIFNKAWNAAVVLNEKNVSSKNAKTDEYADNIQLNGTLWGFGDFMSGNVFSFGYNTGVSTTTLDLCSDDFTDEWTPERYDMLGNGIHTGSLDIDFNADCLASYSTEKVMLAAGYSRIGFGPFVDGGNVLNQNAYNSPQALFVLNGKYIDFTQYFAALESSDLNGENKKYGKFLTFHSVRVLIGKKWHVSYYDAVVYSNRFDPSYFILMPNIITSLANGYNDNLLSGFLFEYNFFSGLAWNTDLTIDHLDYTQLMKIKLTGDHRLALKTGLTYSPIDSLCEMMNLDFAFVTPYTYSYGSIDSVDGSYTSSFTNDGTSMGVALPSDTDQISLRIRLIPMRNLKVTTLVSIAHHANEYESLSAENAEKVFNVNYASVQNGGKPIYATDGGIYTVYGDTTKFMSEDHIMTICRGGVKISYEFPRVSAGSLYLNSEFSYTYIHNAGVDTPMYSGKNATTYAESLTKWENQLHDEYNAYLKFSVLYTY
ncbi:MAG: hypothetical protein M0P01_01270 [Treponema sp.]|nr:hypothetical protein [Treponema sp.]